MPADMKTHKWMVLSNTTLGMLAMVVGLASFGYQLAEVWRHPSSESLMRALIVLCIPLSLALMINQYLRARSGDASRG